MKRIKCIFATALASVLVAVTPAISQTLTGPTSVTVGQTVNYTYYDNNVYSCCYSLYTSPSIGVMMSTNQNGTTIYINYLFTDAGTSTMSFSVFGQVKKSITVTANCPTVSTPSTTFSYSTNTCGNKTITYSGAPPSGINWYWQTTSTGTSKTSSGASYSATSTGTYYLRANCGTTWSAAVATSSVTVNAVPNVPASTTGGTTCSGGTVALSATVGSGGNNIRWYDDPSVGTLLWTGLTYTTPAITSSTTYYACSFNSSGNCESARTAVTATVSIPATPGTPIISSNVCGPKTLSYNGSPPGGVLWYWQGTNSNGQDFTSSTATASTYSATTNGTNIYYYLRSRNTGNGCWGASVFVNPTIDNPPAPTLITTSFTYCEGNQMTMYPINGGYNNMNWYLSGQLVYTGNTYAPTNVNNGTYTYNLKNVSTNNCEGSGSTAVTLQVGGPTANCDYNVNWQESIGYNYANPSDVTGSVVADSRVYKDGFGKPIQQQVKSVAGNQIFAAENIYDYFGNQSLTTLPAPINSSNFEYRYRFVTNASGQKYSSTDFDALSGSGSLNSPNSVANNGAGTLGWYYSSANTLEPNTPTTSYPYSRSYTQLGPNPLSTTSAGPGDAYRMGNSHEVTVEKSKFVASDLVHYYGLRSFFTDNLYYSLSTPVDYSNALANQSSFSAYQGTTVTANSNLQQLVVTSTQNGGVPGVYPIGGAITVAPGNICYFEVTGYKTGGSGTAKLHITDGAGNDLLWGAQLPVNTSGIISATYTVPSGVTSINVGVQWTSGVAGETLNINGVTVQVGVPSASPGNSVGYRIITTDADKKQTATFTDADGNSLATALVTSAYGVTPLQFDNWSYNYYNNLGQLVATIAPKGVIIGNYAQPSYVTYYKYDHLGRMIESTSVDEGTSQFVYNTDNKIRFSQNQEQRNATPKRFSYTNYDYLGRLVESGEYTGSGYNPYIFEPHSTATPSANSVLNIIDNVGFTAVTGVNDARCRDVDYVQYDTPAADYPIDSDHPNQGYTVGKATRTQNENTTTWYAYDEFGRVTTMKQALPFGQVQSLLWTNVLNINVNGSSLNNNNGSGGYWVDRAFSTTGIPANTDGYLEFQAGTTSGDFAMGLSSIDGPTFYTINYGLMAQGGNLFLLENSNASTALTSYTTSDLIRIERAGSIIYYKKNGATFYTSTVPSSSALFADCNMNTVGGSINNIVMGFSNFSGLPSVQWTNLVNVTQSGSNLTRTSGVDGWSAGAFTVQSIPANTNGYIEFSTGETNTQKMVGLSATDTDAGYASINYAIYLDGIGNVHVFENGVSKGDYGTYTTGDLLVVERINSTIRYKRNGTVLYTSTAPFSGTLYGDCSVYEVGATIKNISVKLPNAKSDNLSLALQWSVTPNLTQQASSLTKTGATDSWDAGAFSVQSIPANSNGWIEFMTVEANTYKMMGLSTTDASVGYSTINYALAPTADGRLYVYENGVLKYGASEYFSVNDVFRIERQGSTILYKKNGGVIYTSTIPTTAALFGDCSYYSAGSSFKNITLGLPVTTKTIDYTYDFLGNVTQVAYQKGQSDAFYHHYTYNADGKLTDVATSFDGTTKTAQAKYKYYLHGPLKRVELATNLQGIDYVYTINGALKGINHADVAKDPGGDGSNGFSADVFGQTLNYYPNDYIGAGYNPGTFTVGGLADYYGGQIKSASWFTPIDNAASKKIYGYTYDNLNRFTNAQWGTVSGTPGNYSATLSATSYNESVTGYDKNGNISGLNRKDKSGAVMGSYAYNYVANTNKLSSVTGGTNPVNYTYNSIGQMTQQTEGTLTMNVSYNAYGLTKEVRDGSNNLVEQYFYDDRGGAVKKVYYNAGAPFKTAYYVRDAGGNVLATYEQTGNGQPTLIELPIYGGGRVGMAKIKGGQPKYFYEVNDHLGNVRTVIGSPSTDVITATMEPSAAAVEDKQFKNIAPRVTYAAANNTAGGSTAVRVNNGQPNGGYSGRIAGPGIVLTVAPGDIISAEVYAYYEGGTGYTSTLATSSIVAAAAAIFGGASGPGDPGKIFNAFNTSYTTGGFAGGAGSSSNSIPAGYLNMIMFDGNLNASPTTLPMAAAPVTGAANFAKQKLTIGPINIPAPGYVYIYVNNNSDTPNWLYFDDLKVTQTHSPFVAGGDYYPFGLTMDDRQIKAERYRYGYQGQFAEKDSLTSLNNFEKRLYDSRFGVWASADPDHQFSSPYVGMGDNPVAAVDTDGGYIFFANNIKNQKGLFKSLNKYYSTAGGKERIDKFINDPHKHWFIKVEDMRSINSATGSGKAGARTGEKPTLAQRWQNTDQVYPVSPGDLYSETTVNGYDFVLGSDISTESIGHDFEAHVFNPIVNYPLLNNGGQHLLFGGTHALTDDSQAQANSFARARELYQQLKNVSFKQSRQDNFTSIATTAGFFSRLVFKPAKVRMPRYKRTPVGL